MAGKPTQRVLGPCVAAFLAIGPTYGLLLYLTHQQMLAVACAAFASLLTFLFARVVQLRGKLTLAITVIGFPLLAAVALAGFQALNPFIYRQRSIGMLRNAGVTVGLRHADQAGEWKRNRKGQMLPVWVADRIGPDCMSELRSIDTELGRIQGVSYRDVDTTDLSRINLTRFDALPPVQKGFVDWLNGLSLRSLQLTLLDYSDADGDALAGLRIPYSIKIYQERELGDVSKLETAQSITIRADQLEIEVAEQLSRLPDYSLTLEVDQISSAAVDALWTEDERTYVRLFQTEFDPEAWRSLSRIPLINLSLDDVDLDRVPTANRGSVGQVQHLHIDAADVRPKDLINLIELLGARHLAARLDLEESELGRYWQIPHLEVIWLYQKQGAIEYRRPSTP